MMKNVSIMVDHNLPYSQLKVSIKNIFEFFQIINDKKRSFWSSIYPSMPSTGHR